MKNLLFGFVVFVSAGLCLGGCSSDDSNEDDFDINETSTIPNVRIVGSWELVKKNEDDCSYQNIVWTFLADGTWIVSDPTTPSVTEPDSLEKRDIKQMVSFEVGWKYDAEKDAIYGYLYLTSPSLITPVPYLFVLERKKLMLREVFVPQDQVSIIPPYPNTYFFIRNNIKD